MRFFSSALLIIVLVWFGWHYTPPEVKSRILKTVGIAARRDPVEIRHFLRDVVLPADPAERRAVLTSELKENIAELKRRVDAPALAPASDPELSKASLPELISASDGIIRELEVSHRDMSLKEKVTERVLDAVLPRPAECPVK